MGVVFKCVKNQNQTNYNGHHNEKIIDEKSEKYP